MQNAKLRQPNDGQTENEQKFYLDFHAVVLGNNKTINQIAFIIPINYYSSLNHLNSIIKYGI